jgi:hypothetical protein
MGGERAVHQLVSEFISTIEQKEIDRRQREIDRNLGKLTNRKLE